MLAVTPQVMVGSGRRLAGLVIRVRYRIRRVVR